MKLTIKENTEDYIRLLIEVDNGESFEIFAETERNNLRIRALDTNMVILPASANSVYIHNK